MPRKRSTEAGPNKWTSIMLQSEIVANIQKYIEAHPELGFKSVSDFLLASLREYKYYQAAIST